jgi:hypothetical protein
MAGLVALWAFQSTSLAQVGGPEFEAVLNSDKEFGQIARDVVGALRGMPNVSGLEHACVESALLGAKEMSSDFSHYKFAIAIWNVLRDEVDKMNAAKLLKIETKQIQDEIRIVRERVSSSLGTCSRFPLAIAKGTELLEALKRANGAIDMVSRKL